MYFSLYVCIMLLSCCVFAQTELNDCVRHCLPMQRESSDWKVNISLDVRRDERNCLTHTHLQMCACKFDAVFSRNRITTIPENMM